jgi:hypothetical protein
MSSKCKEVLVQVEKLFDSTVGNDLKLRGLMQFLRALEPDTVPPLQATLPVLEVIWLLRYQLIFRVR